MAAIHCMINLTGKNSIGITSYFLIYIGRWGGVHWSRTAMCIVLKSSFITPQYNMFLLSSFLCHKLLPFDYSVCLIRKIECSIKRSQFIFAKNHKRNHKGAATLLDPLQVTMPMNSAYYDIVFVALSHTCTKICFVCSCKMCT